MILKDIIGETTDYDKKLASEVKKPKGWCKSVSAFANGVGGTLIFGVSNDNEVRGLLDAEKDAEIISEQIKTRLDPIPEFHLSFYRTEDDKTLILLNIRQEEETPYYYLADGDILAWRNAGRNLGAGTGYRCNSFDKAKSCFGRCVSAVRIYGTQGQWTDKDDKCI